MNITDEAVEAAAKALLRIERPSHPTWEEWAKDGQDSWRYEARVILEAAAEHLFKNMRRLSLYEIAMRDNPERMKAAKSKMRAEVKADRAERRALWAEQTRQDREEAWQEGYKAGELDGAYGTNDHEPPNQRNPYCPILKLEQKRAEQLFTPNVFPETRYAKSGASEPVLAALEKLEAYRSARGGEGDFPEDLARDLDAAIRGLSRHDRMEYLRRGMGMAG